MRIRSLIAMALSVVGLIGYGWTNSAADAATVINKPATTTTVTTGYMGAFNKLEVPRLIATIHPTTRKHAGTVTTYSGYSAPVTTTLETLSTGVNTFHPAMKRLEAVKLALTRVGDPYVWGADGPNAFDCSGLVYWAYRLAGFGHMPRTAEEQYLWTRPVPYNDLRRGDLIFDLYGNYAFHVEIYLGHQHVVEAANPYTGVRVYWEWLVPRAYGKPHKG